MTRTVTSFLSLLFAWPAWTVGTVFAFLLWSEPAAAAEQPNDIQNRLLPAIVLLLSDPANPDGLIPVPMREDDTAAPGSTELRANIQAVMRYVRQALTDCADTGSSGARDRRMPQLRNALQRAAAADAAMRSRLRGDLRVMLDLSWSDAVTTRCEQNFRTILFDPQIGGIDPEMLAGRSADETMRDFCAPLHELAACLAEKNLSGGR